MVALGQKKKATGLNPPLARGLCLPQHPQLHPETDAVGLQSLRHWQQNCSPGLGRANVRRDHQRLACCTAALWLAVMDPAEGGRATRRVARPVAQNCLHDEQLQHSLRRALSQKRAHGLATRVAAVSLLLLLRAAIVQLWHWWGGCR